MTTTQRREFYLAEPNEYWILLETGQWQKVDGEPVLLSVMPEADTFLTKTEHGWTVTDGPTGRFFAKSPEFARTRAGAIRVAEKYLGEQGTGLWVKLRQVREQTIDRVGLSPRYCYYPEDDE